jgi:hypothetical protein
MGTLLKYAVIGLLVVGAALAGAALYGDFRWQAATARIRTGIESARTAPTQARYSERELVGLPPPVQRYFRAVLHDGQPRISAARFTQMGEFLVNEANRRWGPFTATQFVTPAPPAFDWDARITMATGIRAYVRDGYVAGDGVLHAALFGLVPLVNQHGSTALARAELTRYLAEAVWYPTALLPARGVHWQPIDASAARATLTDGGTRVSLDFHFGPDGLVDAIRGKARDRLVNGVPTPTPWQARCGHYAERADIRVPLDVEVEWLLPDGPQPYFRGHLHEIVYDTVDDGAG